ncbi:arylsulfatase [Ruania alba]|uniref:Arylsulfatase A n=1 Tax=Ruania alba TaxID=648782 RepID=A0A1H5HCY6_9MICO|nr:arylsulfatase [Ruania alba]SEE25770.1 Arylsulfatase A [Ruania alba]
MSGPEPQDRPNIVVVCTDQWRGDALSVAGHPIVKTPTLDRFANRGVRFTNAYSATPTCVPARMALMSGLSQHAHGRLGYQDGIPFDADPTLPSALRDAGYQTQAIGKMHYSPERVRIGFDDVTLHDGYLHAARGKERGVEWYDDYLVWLRDQAGEPAVSDYFDDGVNCNSVTARPWDRPERLHPTNWAVTESIRWLYRRDPTRPFFLYLSFHRPHPPYNPPRWAFEQYLDPSLPDHEPPVGDWAEYFEAHRDDHDDQANVAQYDTQTRNRARAGYYGNITHIDHQMNRFLESLQEFGVADNTYVLFTSDHGEMLGDHHLWRKGYPYEGSARVPMLLTGPDIPAGQVLDDVVELRDVMPTLLTAAGVDVPEQVEGVPLQHAFAAGADPDGGARVREALHGEHVLLGESIQWIRSGDHLYVWFSGTGREQLFDVAADRDQVRDLAAAPEAQGRLAELRALLVEALSGRDCVAGGQLVAGLDPVLVLDPADRARGRLT